MNGVLQYMNISKIIIGVKISNSKPIGWFRILIIKPSGGDVGYLNKNYVISSAITYFKTRREAFRILKRCYTIINVCNKFGNFRGDEYYYCKPKIKQ